MEWNGMEWIYTPALRLIIVYHCGRIPTNIIGKYLASNGALRLPPLVVVRSFHSTMQRTTKKKRNCISNSHKMHATRVKNAKVKLRPMAKQRGKV